MYAYILTGLQNTLEAKQGKGRDQVGRNLSRFKRQAGVWKQATEAENHAGGWSGWNAL